MTTHMYGGCARLPGADLVFAGACINSPDPHRLIGFYESVFGGARLADTATAALQWPVPGYLGREPVLTVRACSPGAAHTPLRANELGYAHLCFETEDVGGLLLRLQDQGGQLVSSLNNPHRQPGVYATDPDGNLIEIHLPFPTRMTPRTVLRTLGTLLRIKLGWAPAKSSQVRFIHVNVVVPDWHAAVDFYQQGLGATPYGRLRDYKGPYIGQLIGIPGSAVSGRHVALPGWGEGGPTFEVFTYNNTPARAPRAQDDAGILVTEFQARDLRTATARLLQAGAEQIAGSHADAVLLQDLHGNFIRLRPL